MRIYTALFLLLVCAGTVARAQATDANAILHESVKKMIDTRTVAGTITFQTHRYTGIDDSRRFVVRVQRNPNDRIFGCSFNITDESRRNYFAWNGTTSTVVYLDSHRVMQARGKNASWLRKTDLAELLSLFPMAIPKFDDLGDGKIRATYIGRESVRGTQCHVIRIDFLDTSIVRDNHAVLYIGTRDLLPRRQRSGFVYNGARDSVRIDWLDIDLKQNFSDNTFTLQGPPDFNVEQVRPYGANLLEEGTTAPDFALPNDKGDTVSLTSFRGRYVILDFWATWCGPCRMAMPGLQRIHEKLAPSGVAVIGVDCFERGGTDPVKMMRDGGYTYQILLKGDVIAQKYGASSIPTIYLVGPDGTILFAASGYSEENEQEIERLIGEVGMK
jgi:thiol-disulfide isomerase/thioredoxin